MTDQFKSGFAALVGRPNVGKSTLMNEILGYKLAIMSDKAQTTRNKVQGVYTSEDAQIVFIDTPGMHKPKHKLGDFMVNSAINAFREVDVILFLADAEERFGPGEEYILSLLQETKTPVFLVINKIDLVHPDELLKKIETYRHKYDFSEVIPVSAEKGNNIETLKEQLLNYMDEGPQYYPDDHVTDHPEQFIVSEFIREKVLHHTRDEIPHSVAVRIDELTKREDGAVYISATITVERSSQKGIIIGKQGSMLKKIGQEAREDIEAMFGSNVFLDLFVNVEKDWRNRPRWLQEYGYNESDY
ncbi:GTP-binding protein Era [Salsuginibacillus halophilus]|uniref:GTPase Era n=1 Tax=Salsuginibacillus halophilus TaxID=517424 RepID=A0A2P8HFL0_9BACI|nr:GTPase Era [Salsuginibacillus halophilus]PSL45018.1 GTP-binding protein Era [Salsuginibacillus halophilus]